MSIEKAKEAVLKGGLEMPAPAEKAKASEEQLAYASVLNAGMWSGLALLIVTFIIYISGVLPTYVPIEDLPKYWSMRVHDFNVALNAPTGWHWTALVGKGDYLNFVGIASLSGLTIVCYLVIMPIMMRKKDTPYVVIAAIEVLVLALAASGLMKIGGH
jgi:hypothetical protein